MMKVKELIMMIKDENDSIEKEGYKYNEDKCNNKDNDDDDSDNDDSDNDDGNSKSENNVY